MTISEIKDLLEHGHEIEFNYQGKRYSFTFGEVDGKKVVAFCEFYKPDIEFETIDEILDAEYDGFKIAEVVESLDEDDFDIF
jgi:hypothetical protein